MYTAIPMNSYLNFSWATIDGKSPQTHYMTTCSRPTGSNGNPVLMTQKSSTQTNDAGGGKVVYLDRHDVNCSASNGILNGFKLSESNNTMHYDYTCGKIRFTYAL